MLYHEAFHQYIHYAVGQVAPHDWFNEGHGDYFSGALIPQYGTRVTRSGRSGGASRRAKRAIDPESAPRGSQPAGPWIPIEKVAEGAARRVLRRRRCGAYYTGGWALVYFLRESPEAKKHPKWSKIIPTYFDDAEERDEDARDRVRAIRDPRARARRAQGGDRRRRPRRARCRREDDSSRRLKHPWPEDLDLRHAAGLSRPRSERLHAVGDLAGSSVRRSQRRCRLKPASTRLNAFFTRDRAAVHTRLRPIGRARSFRNPGGPRA